MMITINQLRSLIKEAKTIPEYVFAGTELKKIAAEYNEILEQFKAADNKVQELNDRIAALQNSNERGVQNEIYDVLKKITRPGFVRVDSLQSSVKMLTAVASRLVSAVR